MNPETLLLIAEDDDGHASLIEKILRRGGLERPSHRLKDGQETLDFFSDRSRGRMVKSGIGIYCCST